MPPKPRLGASLNASQETYDVPSLFDGKRHRNVFFPLLVATIAIHLGCFWGGLTLVADEYSQLDPLVASTGMLDTAGVSGVMLVLVGAVAGPITLGLTLVSLAQKAATWGAGVAALLTLGLTACSVAIVALSWTKLIQPGLTFVDNVVLTQPDTLRQFLGGLMSAVYVPVSLMGLCIAGYLLRAAITAARTQAGSYDHRPAPLTGSPAPIQPDRLRDNVRGVLYFVLVFLGVGFGTVTLSCIWNFSSTSYFTTPSPYSLVTGLVWTIGAAPTPGSGYIQGVLNVKVYQDVVVYMGVVCGIASLGTVATYTPPLRKCLHRRVRVPLPAILNMFPVGAAWGELVVVSSVLALFGYWFWYWSTGYNRIANEVTGYGDAYPDMHIYARVMGHMTTLSMSFLTFPVVRNSVWEAVYGIPFERAIKYHRVLGRVTWLLVTTHMLLWQIKWLKEGTLANNMLTIENLQVTACGDQCITNTVINNQTIVSTSPSLHADNFTIVLAEFAWLLLTVSLIIAGFLRRWNYELFHYTHHVTLLFMCVAIIHAWSHWYYTAAGLIFYAFDKINRGIKAGRRVTVLSVSAAADVTRLVVDSSIFASSPGGGHAAGQYAFINIPALAPFQWHPITISSAPTSAKREGVVTFHIKNMGDGTWSGDLASLAGELSSASAAAGAEGAGLDLTVSIDGPYGRTGHYYERDTLVLVAGGIGFTPMHAILADLLDRAAAPDVYGSVGRVRHVHVVWVVRDLQLVRVFADTLYAALNASSPNAAGGFVTLHLYHTGGSGSGSGSSKAAVNGLEDAEASSMSYGLLKGTGLGGSAYARSSTPEDAGWCDSSAASFVTRLVQYGRPDLNSIMERVADEAAGAAHLSRGGEVVDMHSHVSALVCGPEGMIAEVSQQAFHYGFDFHSEVFHF